MLSVGEQIALMRRHWPDFRVLIDTGWLVIWEGRLRPFHQSYRVRVFYCLGCDLGTAEILPSPPRVTVEEPLLARRSEAPEDPIPHHFPNDADPARPVLCLYDPREGEWGLDQSIAETTMPWAVNWLACYEGWRATGEWTGGGRHASEEEIEAWIQKKSRRNDPKGRCDSAAFHALGRRIGTFASFPLMAAASAGFTRPLSWRDWRNATLAARRWRGISTSSPVPRPAESSPSALPPALPGQTFRTSTCGAAGKSSRPPETGGSARSDAA
jgi:hypothetical protein